MKRQTKIFDPIFDRLITKLINEEIIDEWNCNIETFEVTQRWEIGGSEGGNCWNDNPSRVYISNEKEPDDIFEKVIEITSPNISHIMYKSLYSDLVKYDQYRNNEYYGNYTEFASKSFNIQKLYNALRKNNLIELS